MWPGSACPLLWGGGIIKRFLPPSVAGDEACSRPQPPPDCRTCSCYGTDLTGGSDPWPRAWWTPALTPSVVWWPRAHGATSGKASASAWSPLFLAGPRETTETAGETGGLGYRDPKPICTDARSHPPLCTECCGSHMGSFWPLGRGYIASFSHPLLGASQQPAWPWLPIEVRRWLWSFKQNSHCGLQPCYQAAPGTSGAGWIRTPKFSSLD